MFWSTSNPRTHYVGQTDLKLIIFLSWLLLSDAMYHKLAPLELMRRALFCILLCMVTDVVILVLSSPIHEHGSFYLFEFSLTYICFYVHYSHFIPKDFIIADAIANIIHFCFV